MKVFIAGVSALKKYPSELSNCKYILESFYSIKEWQIPFIKKCEMFLLDSGAFTFMNSQKRNVDFNEYLTRYINFINKYDIKYFFELDVDSIVGYEKVKQLRKRLENETGKKCIPVWHKSRGKEEYLKMCEEYDYVAIGGIVTKEITKDQYPFFTWFLNEAHKRNCKVHGLGFTNITNLPKYHFDSVDSTAWLYGNMSGSVYKFDANNGIMNTTKAPKGKQLISKAVALNNFNEWVRFQKYARIRL